MYDSPASEPFHPGLVDVVRDNLVADLRGTHRQRQAHVSLPDYCDAHHRPLRYRRMAKRLPTVSANGPLGIQPPRAVTIMHVGPRNGMAADGGRRPDRAGVVVACGPHRLHDASVQVSLRIAEPSYLLAEQLLQDRPAAHGLCARAACRRPPATTRAPARATRSPFRPGRRLTHLVGRQQRLIRSGAAPRIFTAEPSRKHECGRGETVSLENRHRVRDEVLVAVVERQSHQSAPPPLGRLRRAALPSRRLAVPDCAASASAARTASASWSPRGDPRRRARQSGTSTPAASWPALRSSRSPQRWKSVMPTAPSLLFGSSPSKSLHVPGFSPGSRSTAAPSRTRRYTSSSRGITCDNVKCAALAGPAAPSRDRSRSSSSRRRIARGQCLCIAGGTCKPSTPSVTTSSRPPMRRDHARGPRRQAFHCNEPESLGHHAGHDADDGVPPRGDHRVLRDVGDDDDPGPVADPEIAGGADQRGPAARLPRLPGAGRARRGARRRLCRLPSAPA